MNEEKSLRPLKQAHFFKEVDSLNPEVILLYGGRTLTDVLEVDFIPTILFLRSMFIRSNIIADEEFIVGAINWANEKGNFVEQMIGVESVPPFVALMYNTIFFRDVFLTGKLMQNNSDLEIAHFPNTKEWEADLRVATKNRIVNLKSRPSEGKLKEEEREHSTEFIKQIPHLLHFPENISPEDNLRAQDLLIADLFKFYWIFLTRKASLVERSDS